MPVVGREGRGGRDARRAPRRPPAAPAPRCRTAGAPRRRAAGRRTRRRADARARRARGPRPRRRRAGARCACSGRGLQQRRERQHRGGQPDGVARDLVALARPHLLQRGRRPLEHGARVGAAQQGLRGQLRRRTPQAAVAQHHVDPVAGAGVGRADPLEVGEPGERVGHGEDGSRGDGRARSRDTVSAMSDEPPTTPATADRARSFGSVAEAYDRGRPTYPAEAVAWLAGGEAKVVLELARRHRQADARAGRPGPRRLRDRARRGDARGAAAAGRPR